MIVKNSLNMTEQEISKTWEVNLFCYVSELEKNESKIDLKRRRESFNDWKDILAERGNTTHTDYNYVGELEM